MNPYDPSWSGFMKSLAGLYTFEHKKRIEKLTVLTCRRASIWDGWRNSQMWIFRSRDNSASGRSILKYSTLTHNNVALGIWSIDSHVHTRLEYCINTPRSPNPFLLQRFVLLYYVSPALRSAGRLQKSRKQAVNSKWIRVWPQRAQEANGSVPTTI